MSKATKNQRFLWALLDTKYVEIIVDLKSWGLMFDWRSNEMTRPYYISFLCLHFEIGKNSEIGKDQYVEEKCRRK